MPVGYPTNAFFYKGEWYNTDGEGVPATAVTNTLTGRIKFSIAGKDVPPAAYALVEPQATPSATVLAINTAIAACYAAGGGVVELSAGSFVVNGAIRPLPFVHLRGAGRRVTVVSMHPDVNPDQTSAVGGYPNDANIITIEPHQIIGSNAVRGSIRISDMTLDFGAAGVMAGAYGAQWTTRLTTTSADNVGNCITGRGLPGSYLDGVEIERCDVLNAGFHGIAIYINARRVVIERNYVSGNGYRGAHIHGDEGGQTVEELYTRFNELKANGQIARTLADATAGNSGLFVVFHGTKTAHVIGNVVLDEPGAGIHAWGASIGGQTELSQSILICNNIVERCGTGMQIGNGVTGMQVSGNLVAGCKTAAEGAAYGMLGRGLSFAGTHPSYGVAVMGNNIMDNSGTGLYVINGDGLTISGNTVVRNCGTAESAGIVCSNIRHTAITGNTISDNGRIDTTGSINQLTIEATVATTSTESAGTDDVLVSGNLVSAGQRANASVVRCLLGGSAAAPYSRRIVITGNSIRRPKNAAGEVVTLGAQVSRVHGNRIEGTVNDQMTPGSTNTVAANF